MQFRSIFVSLLLAAALRADITIPGSTGYSVPDFDAIRFSKSKGVTGWKDPAQAIQWYGQFKQAGAMTVSAQISLPKGESSKLRLTIGSKSHEIAIEGSDQITEVPFGDFSIPSAGYHTLKMESLNPTGKAAGEIASLTLKGPATEGAHFNPEPRRNAASVHLHYPQGDGKQMEMFYNEVTAVEDPIYTFYMACGFSRGYFGMQVNHKKERRIIFSVWDAAEGGSADNRSTVKEENHTKLLAKGEGVVADVFGNEGTGGHSHLVYPWKTGEAQKFVLTAKPDKASTVYSGFWFHPEKKEWMLIASFWAPKDGKGLRGLHSFSENFGGSNGHLQRKCLYGPGWVKPLGGDKWEEITKASFSHDGTGKANRLDRFMGVEDNRFFLSHGGFIDGFSKYGDPFTRKPSGKPPELKLPAVDLSAVPKALEK